MELPGRLLGEHHELVRTRVGRMQKPREGTFGGVARGHLDQRRAGMRRYPRLHPPVQRVLRGNRRGLLRKSQTGLIGALGFEPAESRDRGRDHDSVHSGHRHEEGNQTEEHHPSRHFPRAASVAPDAPESHNAIGQVFQAMGEFEPALAAYERDLPDAEKWLAKIPEGSPRRGKSEIKLGEAYRDALPQPPVTATSIGLSWAR